jgi:hypothetical protein
MFQGALMLRVFADGRATGAPGGGDWTKSGPGQYVITWPKSTDTVVVSTDGKTFSGSNNYAGFGVSGQRLSGATSGLVGTWRIGNFIAVFTDSGDVRNDQVTGTWTRLSSDTYRIEWNYRFVDQLTIGPDGKTASGKNQLGIPLSGVRTSCGGAPSARSVGSSAASR